MPHFQIIHEEYDDFVILAVNREEGPDAITEFADEHELSFPLLLDETGEIQDDYAIIGYPTSLLVDPDGVIVERWQGALTLQQVEEWATRGETS
jgi:peroxiredoxin